ncbi:hypothetical protein Pelo_7977 [Pelomyxa schiedti]|nr:hypothetical protein Pelo_7977 [Pelomyxa schiedti]
MSTSTTTTATTTAESRHSAGHFDHVSSWYSTVSGFTCQSTFVPMDWPHADILLKIRAAARNAATMLRFVTSDGDAATQKAEEAKIIESCRPEKVLLPSELETLSQLKAGIDAAIRIYGNNAFVRLDTRSPKDAVLAGPIVKQLLKSEIESHPQSNPYSSECYTQDAIFYYICISKAQIVHSANDAMELLTSSNRVEQDLTNAKLHNTAEVRPPCLVVREWKNDIRPEMEFRVFVYNGAVTAITQYHEKLFVPEIFAHKEKMTSLILAKHKEIAPLVVAPGHTYTCDFAILGSSEETYSAFLIEINDPPPIAGTALFNWDLDADRNLIMNGPLQVRVIESPVDWSLQTTLHPPLKQYIDELRHRGATGKPPASSPCLLS